MSDANQVVEYVVERRIVFFTCLEEQEWDCHESVYHSNSFVKATTIDDSCISYHNKYSQNGEAVLLCGSSRHVGIELGVVVHHVQLEGRDRALEGPDEEVRRDSEGFFFCRIFFRQDDRAPFFTSSNIR